VLHQHYVVAFNRSNVIPIDFLYSHLNSVFIVYVAVFINKNKFI